MPPGPAGSRAFFSPVPTLASETPVTTFTTASTPTTTPSTTAYTSTKTAPTRAATKNRQERSFLKLQHRKKLEKTEAISKEIAEPKRQAFEEKWKAAYPKALPVNRHRGEKEILFQKLNEDEQIFLIVGGRFGRELAQAKIGNGFRHGIAVATDQRVLFLDKGLFHKK